MTPIYLSEAKKETLAHWLSRRAAAGGWFMLANLAYLGTPNWAIGDDLELLFGENGRFCPRHLTHITDFGHLPTPTRRKQVRTRIITVILTWLLLSLCGVFLGLYGQGRI